MLARAKTSSHGSWFVGHFPHTYMRKGRIGGACNIFLFYLVKIRQIRGREAGLLVPGAFCWDGEIFLRGCKRRRYGKDCRATEMSRAVSTKNCSPKLVFRTSGALYTKTGGLVKTKPSLRAHAHLCSCSFTYPTQPQSNLSHPSCTFSNGVIHDSVRCVGLLLRAV